MVAKCSDTKALGSVTECVCSCDDRWTEPLSKHPLVSCFGLGPSGPFPGAGGRSAGHRNKQPDEPRMIITLSKQQHLLENVLRCLIGSLLELETFDPTSGCVGQRMARCRMQSEHVLDPVGSRVSQVCYIP